MTPEPRLCCLKSPGGPSGFPNWKNLSKKSSKGESSGARNRRRVTWTVDSVLMFTTAGSTISAIFAKEFESSVGEATVRGLASETPADILAARTPRESRLPITIPVASVTLTTKAGKIRRLLLLILSSHREAQAASGASHPSRNYTLIRCPFAPWRSPHFGSHGLRRVAQCVVSGRNHPGATSPEMRSRALDPRPPMASFTFLALDRRGNAPSPDFRNQHAGQNQGRSDEYLASQPLTYRDPRRERREYGFQGEYQRRMRGRRVLLRPVLHGKGEPRCKNRSVGEGQEQAGRPPQHARSVQGQCGGGKQADGKDLNGNQAKKRMATRVSAHQDDVQREENRGHERQQVAAVDGFQA